jgi:hypothetical protein
MLTGFMGVDGGPPYLKGGLQWGSTAHLEINHGGVSFVVVFNKDEEGADFTTGLDAIRSAIVASPLSGTDLFPSYGIPVF